MRYVLLAALLFVAACSSGSHGPSTPPVTPGEPFDYCATLPAERQAHCRLHEQDAPTDQRAT